MVSPLSSKSSLLSLPQIKTSHFLNGRGALLPLTFSVITSQSSVMISD